MRAMNTKSLLGQALQGATVALGSLLALSVHAAAPGISGPAFDLVAKDGFTSQPDGASIYTWGYGCNSAPAAFVPAAIANPSCPKMQLPGPTLVVNQGDTVTVTLHNSLPLAAGSTSILFPGFKVTTSGGAAGLLTQEALPGSTVSYSFVADTPGT